MVGNFERTTISLTPPQMGQMRQRVENGEFPDITEGIRATVREYNERHPMTNPAPQEGSA